MGSVTYREVEVKSALNAVKGMPFDWSLNPWSGCAHKCVYCFARAYHARYREKNVGSDFDSNVEVRVNIADVLRKELHRHREGSLAIGTATDPYQPIEGKYQLTRRCLEALVDYPMPTSIVTKGPLVVRDIDVLEKEFPVVVPRYAALYQGGVHPAKNYERELEERVRRVRARYEFCERPARPARPPEPETVQLQLAI